MVQLEPARQLASIFRLANETRPVVFLGAGASYKSGVPLADDAVAKIVRDYVARNVLNRDDVSKVKPSDWFPYLQQQSWFVDGDDQLGENFPYAVEYLLRPREYRRNFLIKLMRQNMSLSDGYLALAQMAQRGLLNTIVTTNFDGLIAESFRSQEPHIREITEVNRSAGDLHNFSFQRKNQIVYLHGSIEAYNDRSTPEEIEHLDEELIERIAPFIADSPLVVIGYRGAEKSVMDNFLFPLREQSMNFRNGVYWCTLKDEESHDKVKEFQSLIGTNFFPLQIDGFDELAVSLNAHLSDEDHYKYLDIFDYSNKRNATTFDEEVIDEVEYSDLNQELLLSTMVNYCQRLRRPIVDSETVKNLLLEQGLLSLEGESLKVTKGAYLLFGRNVHLKHPQSALTITVEGKKRQVLKGNLIEQFLQAQEIVNSRDLNPILRIKTAQSSEESPAYHERSLSELLVNMLVHRDYSVDEFSKIEVSPGRSITFTNPGGLPLAILEMIDINESGEFAPNRNLEVGEMRNPAIADVFFGIGSMDKRRSGLPDSKEFMEEIGGDAKFAVQKENSVFVGKLYQPVQSVPSSNTAVRVKPFGQYITNHINFVVVPKKITVIPMPSLRYRRGGPVDNLDMFGVKADSADTPIHIRQRERIISFAPPESLPFVSDGTSTILLSYFLESPGGQSSLSWLLRTHFSEYLRQFYDEGLTLERGRNRAFFRLLEREGNKIKYDAPRRRNVVREVVKKRQSLKRTWYENEGISFDVVRLGSDVAIRIKPYYMFTKPDGVTPLSPIRRSRLATSRMKFDRNPNVESDLNFWARYLSKGEEKISVGGPSVPDLILDSKFFEFEVFEHGSHEQ